MTLGDIVGRADNVSAVLLSIFALYAILRPRYDRTLGSRGDITGKLDRLTIGVTMDYVTGMFGPPLSGSSVVPQGEVVSRGRYLFDIRHGWLVVGVRGGAVSSYAFTVTDQKFHYDLEGSSFGQLAGRLGRSTYHELRNHMTSDIQARQYAGSYLYVETHYFGRPGLYQYFLLSEIGVGTSASSPTSAFSVGHVDLQRAPLGTWGEELTTKIERHRKRGVPDTFTVKGDTDSDWSAEDNGSFDFDSMRAFRAAGPKGWATKQPGKVARYAATTPSRYRFPRLFDRLARRAKRR